MLRMCIPIFKTARYLLLREQDKSTSTNRVNRIAIDRSEWFDDEDKIEPEAVFYWNANSTEISGCFFNKFENYKEIFICHSHHFSVTCSFFNQLFTSNVAAKSSFFASSCSSSFPFFFLLSHFLLQQVNTHSKLLRISS